MKKHVLFLMMLFSFFAVRVSAQSLEDYNFSTGVDASKWITLTSPTALVSSTGDGVASSVKTIGFTFNFAGTNYTQYSVNSDGNLRFGSTATSTSYYTTPFSSTNAGYNNPKINFMGCDGYLTELGHITSQVVGTAPDRILVVEFATSTYSSSSRDAILSWQVQLFEGSNNIQIVYASTAPTILPAVSRQAGMCVNANDVVLINASHQPQYYNNGTSNTIASGTWPEVSRYYLFEAPIIHCDMPATATVSNITVSSADFAWDASSTANGYEVVCAPKSVDISTVTPTTVTGLTYTAQNLTQDCEYVFAVRAICPDGVNTSLWKRASFRTACGSGIETLPYSENFNSYGTGTGTFPTCWQKCTSNSTYPYISTTGGSSLYLYITANNYCAGVAPAILPSAGGVSNVMARFKLYATSLSYDLKVGVMTDPLDIATFVPVATLTPNLTSTWEEKDVYFDSYTGNGQYIAFLSDGRDGSANTVYIDDVMFSARPNCIRPANLRTTYATANSIDLAWDARTETQWNIKYYEGNDTTTAITTSVTTNPATISGLTANTMYTFLVQADCGSEISEWSSAFQAPTLYTTPATLPYICNFEDPGDFANWVFENDSCQNQWVIGSAANNTVNGGNALYISNDGGISNTYNTSSPATVFAIRDVYLDDSYDYYTCTYDYKGMGQASTDYMRLSMGKYSNAIVTGNTTGTVPTIPGSVTWNINGSSYQCQQPTWSHVVLNLNKAEYGNRVLRLYFMWRNDGSSGANPPIAVDNIRVEGFTCPKPTALYFDTLSADMVTMHWADTANTGNYEILLLSDGANPDNYTPFQTSTPNYTFTNLEHSKRYTAYIRSICGTGTSAWASWYVYTTCASIDALPYTENFEGYNSGSTVSGATIYPRCWSRLTTSSTNYPYINTSYHSTGTSSLYFYASTAYYSIGILPPVDTTLFPLNTLMINFKALKSGTTSGYGTIEVGVMTDPTDATTFTLIESFDGSTLTNSATWYEKEVLFNNYAGAGNYIAFRAPATVTNYVYIDDVVVSAIPTCLTPSDITLSGISSDEVTVDWTPRGTENTWQVLVVPAGTNPAAGTPVDVSMYPYTVSNLTDNTEYDVYVKALCDVNDESAWSNPVSFRTRCLPTSVLPYTENFDEYGSGFSGAAYFPGCWTRKTNYSTNYPYISTSYHSTGTSSIYFYCTSANYSLAASQGLDLSQYPANSLMLEFKLRRTSTSYGRLDVGIMTDPDDLTTFTLLKTITPSDFSTTTNFESFTVPLPNAYTDVVYLAFYAPQSITSYVYLDEVVLKEATCSSPSDLEVSNVAGTSALVSWTEAPINVTDYTLEYTEAGQNAWTPMIVTGSSQILTGLTPQTSYDVILYSNCTDGTTDTLTGNFSTTCLAGGAVTIAGGTTTNYYLPVNNNYRYTYSQQIYLASEMNGPADIRSISFQYAYSTAMTDKTDVNIYLGHTTQNAFTGTSNYIPLSGLSLVYSGNLNCSQGWNTFVLDSVFHYNGTDNLVLAIDDNSNDYNSSSYTFYVHSTSGNYRSLYYYSDSNNPDPSNPTAVTTTSSYTSGNRSNVIFGIPCDSLATCIAPNIYDYSTNSESITLSWAPGDNESNWELQYRALGDSTWTTEINVTSPYTLTNLLSNTEYSVRLRSNCGFEYSNWASITAHTTCAEIIQLPYTEDFESATGSSYACFVDCWTRGTNYSYNYPYVTTQSSAPNGPKALYFYGSTSTYSYACTPPFDSSVPMDSLQIRFNAYKTSSTYLLEVGIMSDPTDVSTFQPIATITPSTTSTWEMIEVKTNTYTGNGRYVAFRSPQYISSYMFIDDIHIDYIPACVHVENIHTTNVTSNSADITWTAGGDETNWVYVYGPYGTIDLSLLTDNDWLATPTNTVTLDNLLPATRYEVFVKADCGGGYYSMAMDYSFWTDCVPVSTLPYIEDFDSYGVTTSSTAANPGPMPICWNRICTYSEPRPFCSSSYSYNGTSSLYFYATSSTYNVAVLPELDASMNLADLQLSFEYRTLSTSYTSPLVIGVMTNPATLSTFVPVDTITANSANWEHADILFDNYTGTGKYIALKFAPTASTDYFMIDHAVLDIAPSCDVPTNLNVSVTTTSATINWQSDPGENNFEVLLVPDTSTVTDFTQAQAHTGNTYTINANPGDGYTFYVRTVCSNGLGYSNWVSTSFSLLRSDPAQVPYFHDFEDAAENFAWTICNTTTANKWYIGKPAGYTDSVLYVSSDNGANATYVATANTIWAYRDFTFGNASEFELSFNWKCQGESNYDYIKVYIGNPVDVQGVAAHSLATATTHDPAGAVDLGKFNLQSDWVHERIALNSSYANTTKRLYIRWNNDGSVLHDPSGVIDSIRITASNCSRPYNVTLNSQNNGVYTIGFTPASATDNAWEYVYGVGSFNPDAATPNTTQSTTFDLTGLSSSTSYTVYVRTSCGGGEYSAWSDALTFETPCGAVTTLPFTENFDTYGTGTTAYPHCWGKINTYTSGDRPYCNSSYAYGGSTAGLYFYSSSSTYNIAITPEFDATIPVNTLKASFKFRGNSTSYATVLVVGVMTSPTDVNTFVPVDTVLPGTTISAWVDREVSFANYTGMGHYIAFKSGDYGATTAYYAGMDNLVISLDSTQTSTCVFPTGVTASNITQTSANITWTAGGTENAWELQYKTASDADWSNSINVTGTPSHNLTGLTAGTQYQVRVRAVCSATETSNWSTTASFTTTQSSVTPPTVTTDTATNITTHTATLNGTVTAGTETVMVTGFEWKATVGGAYTPVNVPSTWMIYDLTGLTPNTGYTFRAFAITASGTTYGNEQTFTTLEQQQETCAAPTNVTASNITNNSADISWTQHGDVTNWDVNYRVAGADAWNSVTTTTNPYTLSGLSEATSYEVQVIAHCTNGVTSDPSATITLTTVGINDYELSNVVVYPNPTTGMIQIQNSESRIENVEVYDAYGKMLNVVNVNDNTTAVDLSNYAAGTYFVKIVTENGVVTKRVVKQ